MSKKNHELKKGGNPNNQFKGGVLLDVNLSHIKKHSWQFLTKVPRFLELRLCIFTPP